MNKLWFKRKKYGWGWYPSSWQGWLVTIFYCIFVLIAVLDLSNVQEARRVVFSHIIPIVFLTTMLIIICYKTGERPRWQWGNKKKNG